MHPILALSTYFLIIVFAYFCANLICMSCHRENFTTKDTYQVRGYDRIVLKNNQMPDNVLL